MAVKMKMTARNAAFQRFETLKRSREKRHRQRLAFVEGVHPFEQAISNGWAFDSVGYPAGKRLSGWAHDMLGKASIDTLYEIEPALMDELREIKGAIEPHEILLVVDAMTGQEAVNVAKTFDDLLDITGVILTKMDGDTRGGAALSVRAVTGKPIKFVGTGEKLDDLEAFHPDRMASRILGMGDVLSLIEDAQNTMDQKAAEKAARKMLQNKLDLNDLLEQFQQVKKMGPLKNVLSKLPGMEKQLKDVDIDDRQMDRMMAIILSMTKEEREKPSIINPSRKRRIAAGSGMQVEDVNRLLKQFEQTQKLMKQFKGMGKGRKRKFMPPMMPM